MKKAFSVILLLSFLATACAAPTSAPAQSLAIENTAAPTFTPVPTFTEEVPVVVVPTETVLQPSHLLLFWLEK